MNDHYPGWHGLVVGRCHGITVAGNAVLHWQAQLALAFRKNYPRNPGHALFSLALAQRDVEHTRFARAHGGHVDRDFTRTRIVLFKHNRAGGLREDNVRAGPSPGIGIRTADRKIHPVLGLGRVADAYG